MWGVVLAGGEGRRLRPLLRRALGEEEPPQYAPLLGPRSLLGETLDRIARRIPVARTVVVTVRAHVPHIAQAFTGVSDPPYVLLQPRDRGTAPAVLHAARWIARRDPDALLAVFPCDHFVLGAATFMSHVLDVARAIASRPERVAVLGAPATSLGSDPWPGGDYGLGSDHGWIEPGPPLPGLPLPDGRLATVRAIASEPPPAPSDIGELALGLGQWNTGVAVGSAAALMALGARTQPELSALLGRAHGLEDLDAASLRDAYAPMEPVAFEEMAAADPACLALSTLPRLTWWDVGSPDGLLAVLARMRVRPAWADAVDHAAVPA